MNKFGSVVQNYYPAGEDINDYFPGIVNDHLDEILADLPCIESLPMPSKLGDVRMASQTCPLVVDETITIAALRRHLTEANPETLEIRITIFGNGTQVLEVGTAERVPSDDSVWQTCRERGIIDFHTHPDPTEAEYMRQPSIGDITSSIVLGQSIAIGSRDGLTHVPKPEVDLPEHTGLTLWRDYVAGRGFDASSFSLYGPSKIYTEFVSDIIMPRFIAWRTISGETSLESAIISQRGS